MCVPLLLAPPPPPLPWAFGFDSLRTPPLPCLMPTGVARQAVRATEDLEPLGHWTSSARAPRPILPPTVQEGGGVRTGVFSHEKISHRVYFAQILHPSRIVLFTSGQFLRCTAKF